MTCRGGPWRPRVLDVIGRQQGGPVHDGARRGVKVPPPSRNQYMDPGRWVSAQPMCGQGAGTGEEGAPTRTEQRHPFTLAGRERSVVGDIDAAMRRLPSAGVDLPVQPARRGEPQALVAADHAGLL